MVSVASRLHGGLVASCDPYFSSVGTGVVAADANDRCAALPANKARNLADVGLRHPGLESWDPKATIRKTRLQWQVP
jgi:hypothetical protein